MGKTVYFSHKDASRFLETGKETLGSVTEMPEIDHGVSDQLQAKMVKANPFKSDEKPFGSGEPHYKKFQKMW